MSTSKLVKIVVNVPEANADMLRSAMSNAGAGKIGNYSHCSFSVKGISRFRPETRANPAIGQIGKLEEVVAERIEIICAQDKLRNVLQAIRKVHPYEEPTIDVYPLLSD